MNEDSESSPGLTPEQELLIEGCKSYLDVIHATNAFQTRVYNAARDVIGAERDRISKIAKLAKPLEAPANAFVDPAGADNNFDGSEAWIGAYMWLERPVYATLYLALVFHHDPNGDQQLVHVCFALEAYQRYILNQLGNIFGQYQNCMIHKDWGWLAVELRRPLENPLMVREELTTMLDNALTWWDNNSNSATTNDTNDESA